MRTSERLRAGSGRVTGAKAAVACGVLLASVCVGAAGCGDGGGSTAPTTTSSPRPDRLEIELLDCHQFGTNTGVDPTVASTYLSADQSLYLDGDGKARFALIAKDCRDITVDGKSVGPAHFSTAWVRVTGSAERRSRPGAPAMVAINETDYFHPVLLHTDNAAYAEATAAFGIPMTLADSMTFDPPEPGVQTGSAVDTEREQGLSYRWSVQNEPSVDAGPEVFVVHVLEGPDGSAGTLTYDIECLARTLAVSSGLRSVELEPGSDLEPLLGDGFTGGGSSPDVDCTIDVVRR
jgi:hypothetical protein